MSRPLKHRLTLVIVAIALAASAAGAYAATSGTANPGRQAFLKDVARRLHVTPAQLRQALEGAYADRLAAAVKAGRLTKAQAAAIEQQLKQAGAVPFGAGLGLLSPAAGFGPGVQVIPGAHLRLLRPGVFVRPGVLVRPGFAVRPPGLIAPDAFGLGLGLFPAGARAALSYLGLTPAKLRSEIRGGKTLAQIATSQGKTARGLEAAITAAIAARLGKRVAHGRLTSAQARKLQAVLGARIAAIVNQRLSGMFPVLPFLGRVRGVVVLPKGFRMVHPRFFFAPPGLPRAPRATRHHP